jgi:hypothetical protein
MLEIPIQEKECTFQLYSFAYTAAISLFAPFCGSFRRSFIVTVRGSSVKKDFLHDSAGNKRSKKMNVILFFECIE